MNAYFVFIRQDPCAAGAAGEGDPRLRGTGGGEHSTLAVRDHWGQLHSREIQSTLYFRVSSSIRMVVVVVVVFVFFWKLQCC